MVATQVAQALYATQALAIGVGAAIAILACAAAGWRRPRPTFALTAIGFSALLTLLAQMSSVGPAVAVTVLVGGFHSANMTLSINFVRHEAPEAMRGRVMAIQITGLIGVVPITALVGGWAADEFGVGTPFTTAGLVCLAFSLVALRWIHLLRPTLATGPDPLETGLVVGALVEEEG